MHAIVLQARPGRVTGRLTSLLTAGLLGLAAAFAPATQAQTPQRLPSIQLSAGMHLIKAEVARTPREQQIGLMWRTSMGTNEGMLFVFDRPSRQCFWMKNTLIPLAIAFVDDDGTIVNIDEMQPQTEGNHCSERPVRFVLEMNTGWFHKRGIKAGSRLGGAPFTSP